MINVNIKQFYPILTIVFSATSFFDIKFTTNRKDEGRGFKCTVSCSEEAPTTTTPPPVSDCMCGKANRKNKIVGGSETDNHEYPWQVRTGQDCPSMTEIFRLLL